MEKIQKDKFKQKFQNILDSSSKLLEDIKDLEKELPSSEQALAKQELIDASKELKHTDFYLIRAQDAFRLKFLHDPLE